MGYDMNDFSGREIVHKLIEALKAGDSYKLESFLTTGALKGRNIKQMSPGDIEGAVCNLFEQASHVIAENSELMLPVLNVSHDLLVRIGEKAGSTQKSAELDKAIQTFMTRLLTPRERYSIAEAWVAKDDESEYEWRLGEISKDKRPLADWVALHWNENICRIPAEDDYYHYDAMDFAQRLHDVAQADDDQMVQLLFKDEDLGSRTVQDIARDELERVAADLLYKVAEILKGDPQLLEDTLIVSDRLLTLAEQQTTWRGDWEQLPGLQDAIGTFLDSALSFKEKHWLMDAVEEPFSELLMRAKDYSNWDGKEWKVAV